MSIRHHRSGLPARSTGRQASAALSSLRFKISTAFRFRLVLLGGLLLLPAIACGLFNPQYYRNNEVRLAVYEYERATRGPVDELVIDFERNEPRLKFEGQNEHGGRTVWLNPIGAPEYFALLPAESTFLYIQKIEYANNHQQATVTVYRGAGRDFEGRELTLIGGADKAWTVINDMIIDRNSLGSKVGEE